MTTPTVDQRSEPVTARYLPALDGVRALAILLVLVCHYIYFACADCFPSRFMATVASFCGTGVDLFFVLSGFLITRILLAARERPHFLKNFYMRRFLRIFPLYYGFLLVIYIALPLLHLGAPTAIGNQIWAWTYIQDVPLTFWPSSALAATQHFWSLAVEEHFYLVWPFIVKYSDSRRLPVILLSAVPFSILSRCLLIWMGYTPNYFTPCVVDGLGLGSFLAVVAQNPESLAALRRRVVPLFGVAAVALAGGLYLFSGAALPIVQALKGTAYAVTYSLLLLTVLTAKPGGVLHFAFANRAMAAIGKYSYGMYVIHIMVVGLLGTRIRTLWPPLGFTLYATAVFLAAAVIWQVWERPFLNLKSRFTA